MPGKTAGPPYIESATQDFVTASNASGNTAVSMGSANSRKRYDITFSGSAGTRIVYAQLANATKGDQLILKYHLPATSGIVIQTRNATTGGTLLDTITTDASGDDAVVILDYDGTAWQLRSAQYPAF